MLRENKIQRLYKVNMVYSFLHEIKAASEAEARQKASDTIQDAISNGGRFDIDFVEASEIIDFRLPTKRRERL